MMKLPRFAAFFCCLLIGSSVLAAPSKAAVAYQLVTSFSPEQHASSYFKKAHRAVVALPEKTGLAVSPPTAWDVFVSTCLGIAAAFFAGVLLMLTPCGALALIFALGVLYNHRNRSFETLVKNGLVFVAAFIPVYATSHMFLPQIDEFLEIQQVHFWFSLFFIFWVTVAAFSLLGIIQLRLPRLVFKEEQLGFFDSLVIGFCGAISALMLLTQKTSALFMAARQVELSSVMGSGFLLSFFAAVGVGSVIFLCWIMASHFMKEEYINLWVVDLLSVLAWFSLYKSMIVMRPYMFLWQYNFLLAMLACCAGVYYWMSVRMEITYQYIDTYSKVARVDTFLHIFGGMRFFNGRILFKRFVAVVAFVAMGTFVVKSYLFYQRITLKQAIIQGLKSL